MKEIKTESPERKPTGAVGGTVGFEESSIYPPQIPPKTLMEMIKNLTKNPWAYLDRDSNLLHPMDLTQKVIDKIKNGEIADKDEFINGLIEMVKNRVDKDTIYPEFVDRDRNLGVQFSFQLRTIADQLSTDQIKEILGILSEASLIAERHHVANEITEWNKILSKRKKESFQNTPDMALPR